MGQVPVPVGTGEAYNPGERRSGASNTSGSDERTEVTAYLIFQGEVIDPELYAPNKMGAAASIAAAGGRYLVLGGDVEVLGGELPAGGTVVEFPSRRVALDWYHGTAYRQVRGIREQATRTSQLILVDGVDGTSATAHRVGLQSSGRRSPGRTGAGCGEQNGRGRG